MTDELSRAAERLTVSVESNLTCDHQHIVQVCRGIAPWALHDHGPDSDRPCARQHIAGSSSESFPRERIADVRQPYQSYE